MADVFISYRKADRARAEALANALKVENLDVWWDVALETGDTFDEKIQAVLEKCKAVIVIWSKESVKSDWVRAESSIGRERGILVPVMIQHVNIPVPFNLLHTANLIGWHGDRAHAGYRDVVKQVKELAGKSSARPLKPPPNPALRAAWRTAAAVIVVAAIGAGLWYTQPWQYFQPKDPVVEARKLREASLAKLAPYGVTEADLVKNPGRHIARKTFNPDMRDQLATEVETGDPALLTLTCAVDFWLTEDGVPDSDAALSVCAKAAETGEPFAHLYYGQVLTEAATYEIHDENRLGLERSATAEIRKAADRGVTLADIELAWRLVDGVGAPADPVAAETLFKSARAKGYPAADYGLARLYLSDKVASPLSAEEAFALMRKAADAGDPNAQFDMAEQLVEGWNIPADYRAALAYYSAAAAADAGDISFRAATFIEDTERRIAEQAAAAAASPPPEAE